MTQTERFNLSQKLRKEAFAAVNGAWCTNKPDEWFSVEDVHVSVPSDGSDYAEITFGCRKNPVYEEGWFDEYNRKLKAALREHGFKGVRIKKRTFIGYDPYGGNCGYSTGNGARRYYEITVIQFKITEGKEG